MIEKNPNSFYYKDDGSFNEEAGRQALAELFEHHRYSLKDAILESIEGSSLCEDKLWIMDFCLGDFTNAGMGGIIFVNDKENGYFAHDIYLLPFQMIPQHAHNLSEGKPPKHEAWHVRHGEIWTFSQGGIETDLCKYPADIAEALQSQLAVGAVQCFNGKYLKTGQMNDLTALDEPHFMIAGPEGAIVSEYASYHSFDGLVFTNPAAKLANSPSR